MAMLVAALIGGAGAPTVAAETDIPIPATAPDDPMQSFLRIANGSATEVIVDVVALDAAGAALARWSWRVPARDTVTRLLKAELPADALRRLARLRVTHPDSVTVQHVVGKAPPEKPGAFSVPA
jgi:hypothetical protein